MIHYVLQKSKASDFLECNQSEIDWIEWTYTEQYLFSQRLNWKINYFIYLYKNQAFVLGIMRFTFVDGTQWAVVIFIDPYNSLYHS